MDTEAALIKRIYEAFNARDIDRALAAMHPDVDWPNGWESGRIRGRDAVKDYWTRQWAAIDPTVVPVGIDRQADGRIAVQVHQLVRDKAGATLSSGEVEHVYTVEDGLICAMEIH